MRKSQSSCAALIMAGTLAACGSEAPVETTPETAAPTPAPIAQAAATAGTVSAGNASSPNYLIMIGDDMGLETLSCYNLGQEVAHTPNLDTLCNEGLRFDNFYVQPACSPTRATIMTGQYGFANGVGVPIPPLSDVDWGLPDDAVDTEPAGAGGGGDSAPTPGLAPDAYTFAHALKADESLGYHVGAIGKWHLADHDNGALEHPMLAGFDYHAGPVRGGGVIAYDNWSKSTAGARPIGQTSYVTSTTVDDAIDWMASTPGDNPFALWVAFNAPHTPFHMPPKQLLSSDLKDVDPETATDHQEYSAMLEAMDTEIGRLVESLDADTRANTYVMFLGDNGTPGQVATAPFTRQRAKGSIYRGGINVPFFVTGPGVPSGASPALSNGVDLFATMLDLSNAAPDPNAPERPFHSVSLGPVLTGETDQVRSFAFSDWFGPRRNGVVSLQTIRNLDYKLVVDLLGDREELYDLRIDPNELTDLLQADLSEEAQTNLDSLRAEREALLATNTG